MKQSLKKQEVLRMNSTQCELNLGIQADYKKFWFTVPGAIVGKGRPRFTTQGRFVRAYTPKKTRDYEQKIAMYYRKTTSYKSNKALRVKIFAYREVPKSTTKKLKNCLLDKTFFCTVKPDIDNIIKVVLDALNDVAYYDDIQVCQLVIMREYAENECLKVCIEEIGERKPN
ncbi:RusA family crossover junction endodeoxyribonuclease [Faecalibacillus faecis]|uniref:RusA family crossover junction endodeoxyribonuclease n=2 Tax=Faecalibacillus faecis TaxID=1982628 RepID=A0A2T3G2C3_9FIRM|nr:RusA family crossover junction endodeoxyribonuclease [Faecalibacillus faecis]